MNPLICSNSFNLVCNFLGDILHRSLSRDSFCLTIFFSNLECIFLSLFLACLNGFTSYCCFFSINFAYSSNSSTSDDSGPLSPGFVPAGDAAAPGFVPAGDAPGFVPAGDATPAATPGFGGVPAAAPGFGVVVTGDAGSAPPVFLVGVLSPG